MLLLIEAVRWVGLTLALALTVVVLKEVVLVLRTLGHIRQLALRIRDASRSLADNVAPAAGLGELEEPATRLGEASAALREAAGALGERTSTLTGGS